MRSVRGSRQGTSSAGHVTDAGLRSIHGAQRRVSRRDRQVMRGSDAEEPVLTSAHHSVRCTDARCLQWQRVHLEHIQHRLPRQESGRRDWLAGRSNWSPGKSSSACMPGWQQASD